MASVTMRTADATGSTSTRPRRADAWTALELTAWSAAVLVTVNTCVGLVSLLLRDVQPDVAVFGVMLAILSWWALVGVLVLGWPLALLALGCLRRVTDERLHVLVLALVGATVAVLVGLVGRTSAPEAGLVGLLAAEGALTAGGGRYLLGVARQRRARAVAAGTTTAGAAA